MILFFDPEQADGTLAHSNQEKNVSRMKTEIW